MQPFRAIPTHAVASPAMTWAPTIALSWLWGLGFFFSFQIILHNGVLGFLMFAVPNALGLFGFGWVLGDPARDPDKIFRSVQNHFTGLFLTCQVLAVAITLFASVQYLFIPLFGPKSILILVVFTLLAVAVGHASTMQRLKRLHGVYLGVGLAAAFTLLVGLDGMPHAHTIAIAAFDSRFYGLVIPSVVGFALGPWTDVQHWQRVIAIRKEGGSIRAAYAWGAALFFLLIAINAAIAAAAGPALQIVSFDGLAGLQGSVAAAVAKSGLPVLALAFVVWAGVSIASTLDSFYFATSWLLRATTSSSKSPLLAFVPAGVVTSPVWFLFIAVLVAGLLYATNASMLYLMIPFATLLAGPAACLVCETVSKKNFYDGMLCTLIGTAAILIFSIGYIGDVPAFMTIAPMIALVGAFQAIKGCFDGRPAPGSALDAQREAESFAGPQLTINVAVHEMVLSQGFDGQWYVMHVTPTYDDTNSVGNVYFANYFRWVGKTRELFFNACMPDFDVKTSDFLVLTKGFEHEFRRELREFQPVSVRVRIGSYNRKFVTILHEIHSRTDGVVGRGQQTIFFVDRVTHRPLDIPGIILERFLPYYTPNATLPHRGGGSENGASAG